LQAQRTDPMGSVSSAQTTPLAPLRASRRSQPRSCPALHKSIARKTDQSGILVVGHHHETQPSRSSPPTLPAASMAAGRSYQWSSEPGQNGHKITRDGRPSRLQRRAYYVPWLPSKPLESHLLNSAQRAKTRRLTSIVCPLKAWCTLVH
jgi:hypothetical protein